MMAEPSDPPTLEQAESLTKGGSFEEALAALEAVVDVLERGRLSMTESLTWYEIGLGLSRRCSDLLQQAELRISIIEERYAVTPTVDDLWDADGS